MKNVPDGYHVVKKYTINDENNNKVVFTMELHEKYYHKVYIRCYINDHRINVSSLNKKNDAELFFKLLLNGACDEE